MGINKISADFRIIVTSRYKSLLNSSQSGFGIFYFINSSKSSLAKRELKGEIPKPLSSFNKPTNRVKESNGYFNCQRI